MEYGLFSITVSKLTVRVTLETLCRHLRVYIIEGFVEGWFDDVINAMLLAHVFHKRGNVAVVFARHCGK